ncbi:MAG TPA: hypothetical protein VJN69_03455 [Candidatus Acidoferrales bacterium]|nr:hypothetical protein [Candidatus Acidoferrales bacterium]
MNRKLTRDIVAAAVACTLCGAAFAQFRLTQPEATTARFDAQHTGWIPVDRAISPDRMNGFSLQWKTKVENTARNGAALSGGVVAGAGLGVTLAHLGASGDRTIAIDMDNGHVFFDRAYSSSVAPASSSTCLNASLATPTLSTPLTPPAAPPLRADGQAANGPNTQLPYSSVIGEPGEGISPVKPGAMFAAPGTFFARAGATPYDGTPASEAAGIDYAEHGSGKATSGFGGEAGAPGRGARGAGGRGNPGRGLASAFGMRGGGLRYALSDDGFLHGLTPNDGLDGQQPMPFLPAGSQASDLIMVNGIVYAATTNGCGSPANGLYAIKPASTLAGEPFPKVSSWMTGTANPHTPSFSADGHMFVTVGFGTSDFSDSVISLHPDTLEVKDKFTQRGANFVSSPTILRIDNRDIIAAQAADGRVFLLDSANLSKPLYVSMAATKSSGYQPGGFAAWQDPGGTRWLLSTTSTSVVAYKVDVNESSISLSERWSLGGLNTPLPPLVVNGLVFALSSGDSSSSSKSTAELYALDGMTGKTLWASGKTVVGYVPRTSALWNSLGQILFATSDSTIYAFGMNLERHL